MKKKYTKPQLYIDNFELSQNIALGCEITYGATSGNPSSCGWFDEFDGTVFLSNACEIILESEDAYWGFCYQNPDSTNSIYRS